MPEDAVNVQAVIEQLMTRIAQLELEVAILKSLLPGDVEIPIAPDSTISADPKPSSGGYM